MDSKNSNNNISDLVKLKQKLKKWKKQSNPSTTTTTTTTTTSSKKRSLSRSNSIKEGITFLRRKLSFNDLSTSGGSSSNNVVPKGFLAVHVGKEMTRFAIPTNYLSHQAFGILLKEAEEEFGFQQEGILRIPCEVEVFESILKVVEVKSKSLHKPKEAAVRLSRKDGVVCGSSGSQGLSHSHYPPSPMCR